MGANSGKAASREQTLLRATPNSLNIRMELYGSTALATHDFDRCRLVSSSNTRGIRSGQPSSLFRRVDHGAVGHTKKRIDG